MAFWRRSTPGKAHWSKDYIEHLRAIHFALIAVAVVCILISGAPDTYRIRAAQRQLRTIQDLIGKRAAQIGTEYATKDLLIHLNNYEQVISIPAISEIVKRTCNGDEHETSVDEVEDYVKAIETLEDFERTWDESNCSTLQTHIVSKIATTVLIGDDIEVMTYEHSHPERLAWTSAHAKNKKIDKLPVRLSVSSDTLAIIPRNLQFILYSPIAPRFTDSDLRLASFLADSGGNVVSLPVKIQKRTVFESTLRRRFENAEPRWNCPGTFSQCFSQLDWFRKNKPNYRVQDLADSIEDELGGFQPHDFEALGIKFPIENQARWGIILLLVLQLYLWLHLRELSPSVSSTDDGVNVAWIGLYPSLIARVITWISIVGLPLFALIMLAQNGMHFESPFWQFVRSHKTDVFWWAALPGLVCLTCSVMSSLAASRLASKAAEARKHAVTQAAGAGS